MRALMSVSAFVALALAAGAARADESKVPLSEVPKAGQTALKAMFPAAEIVGAAKETEDGKTVFEITLKQKGKNIDVTIGEDGKIQVIEEEIAERELPAAVRKTLEAKYPKAKYAIIEEVSNVKEGKATLEFFEALLITAKKDMLEIQITPDGKIKNEEKKSTEKD
jgi:hypothetical protein